MVGLASPTGLAVAGRSASAPPLPVDGRSAASSLCAPKGARAVEPRVLSIHRGTQQEGPPKRAFLLWRPKTC